MKTHKMKEEKGRKRDTNYKIIKGVSKIVHRNGVIFRYTYDEINKILIVC